MPKGICPECGQPVLLSELVCSPESGIEQDEDREPFYLCAFHGPVEGCKTTKVVSVPSGEIKEVHCDGSLRPPEKLVH